MSSNTSKKKVKGLVKLQICAGAAAPSPPVGPALGQHGVNIVQFCKDFNAKTAGMEPGMPLPVVITIYTDRSFSFVLKKPPLSALIKRFLGIKAGAKLPGSEKLPILKRSQVEEIAKMKSEDMTGVSLEACASMVVGAARSMGIKVAEEE